MRLPLPRTTFGLVALLGVGLGLVAFLLGAVVLFVSHEALEVQLDRRVATETRALTAVFNEGGTAALVVSVKARGTPDPHDLKYLLVDAAGRRLAGALPGPPPGPGWLEFLPVNAPGAGAPEYAQALTTRLADGSLLVVAAPRRPLRDADRLNATLVIVTFAAMSLAAIAAAWALRAVIGRRLDAINTTARAITAGDLARRIPRDGRDDDFDRLSETLNQMLDRNGELLESLRQVSTDIAHDLRTPMTRQLQGLETALERDLSSGAYRDAIARAATEGREMLEMFAALLRISEIESLDLRAGFAAVDLSEVATRVVEAFEPGAEASGHQLRADLTPASVLGDRRLLAQLVANLVENSLRHTPAGSRVTVAVSREGDHAVLTVADDGPGIPASDRERVQKRFTRLEASRSTPGHGLGLSVAAAIARVHFSALDLQDAAPGLRVRVAFPAAGAS